MGLLRRILGPRRPDDATPPANRAADEKAARDRLLEERARILESRVYALEDLLSADDRKER